MSEPTDQTTDGQHEAPAIDQTAASSAEPLATDSEGVTDPATAGSPAEADLPAESAQGQQAAPAPTIDVPVSPPLESLPDAADPQPVDEPVDNDPEPAPVASTETGQPLTELDPAPSKTLDPSPANPDADPAAEQFPSEYGETGLEVAARSADQDDEPSEVWVKEIVIGPPVPGYWPPENGADSEHDANKALVLNQAIQQGVHPHGDVEYVGCEVHADGISLVLTYQVPVVPAHVDPQTPDTLTPAHSDYVDNSYPAGSQGPVVEQAQ